MSKCHSCKELDRLLGQMVAFVDIHGDRHEGLLEKTSENEPWYGGRYRLSMRSGKGDLLFYKSHVRLNTLQELC